MKLRFRNRKESPKNSPREQEKPKKSMPKPKIDWKPGKNFQSILDGSILTREQVIRLLPFIFFLVLLAVGLIANTYYAEKLIRRIDEGNTELKELQIEYINSREKLMHSSRVSTLSKDLESTGIKEATVPPYRISIGEEADD